MHSIPTATSCWTDAPVRGSDDESAVVGATAESPVPLDEPDDVEIGVVVLDPPVVVVAPATVDVVVLDVVAAVVLVVAVVPAAVVVEVVVDDEVVGEPPAPVVVVVPDVELGPGTALHTNPLGSAVLAVKVTSVFQ